MGCNYSSITHAIGGLAKPPWKLGIDQLLHPMQDNAGNYLSVSNSMIFSV